MPKSFQTLAYVLPVLAVLAFLLSWKFFISPDPVETSPDHQARLSATAANVFAPAETSEDELRIYAVNIVRKVPFRKSIYWLWHLPWPGNRTHGCACHRALALLYPSSRHYCGSRPSRQSDQIHVARRYRPGTDFSGCGTIANKSAAAAQSVLQGADADWRKCCGRLSGKECSLSDHLSIIDCAAIPIKVQHPHHGAPGLGIWRLSCRQEMSSWNHEPARNEICLQKRGPV